LALTLVKPDLRVALRAGIDPGLLADLLARPAAPAV